MDTWTDVELVVEAKAEPGEGPLWDVDEGVLWWVDIIGGAVHRYDPRTGADTVLDVGKPVGAVVRRASGGLVVAVVDGFASLDPGAKKIEMLVEVGADDPSVRMNDGKVDPAGRFWAGTMAFDASAGAGALYRLDPDLSVTTILEGVTISNGMDWTTDRSTMYYIDSMAHGVDVFDYDLDTGGVTNRRRLVDIAPEDGLPDGMTLDADGFLWVAVYNSSSVRRYAPDGTLVGVVELPTPHITSCAFGGEDLGDLYITSAAGADELGGSLFRCRPGATGAPVNAFAG